MSEEPQLQEFTLNDDNELRFEVSSSNDVILELSEGRAEIFGTELESMKKYIFPASSRVAVFSWKGARLELTGQTVSAYVAERTPMVIYLNTHAALEQIRQHNEEVYKSKSDKSEFPKGPRIMIVGPTDVGKTTVCRLLCNYAVRQGRSPILVDLDVGQGAISVPGTIGALFLQQTADVVEGFDQSKPLVYNYGYTSPSGNLQLYDSLVKELAEDITERCKQSMEASIGGLVINTCGWVNGEGYQCITNAAGAFEVDVVVVIDHERLYNELQKDLPQFVKIIHQPKSGGVETRSSVARKSQRNNSIHRYFYGTRSNKFYPHTFEMSFSEIILCKIGTDKLPDSCLPFGVKQDDHQTKVVLVPPSADHIHRMFAVSPCPTVSQAVVKASVLGFVVITDINLEDKTMTVLSPQAALPCKVLVWTDVKFIDDQIKR
ncbi:unnamed protein product [Auanema sp. JU1783]|nr:unnamed protein product [Auanema sp. JU1783]